MDPQDFQGFEFETEHESEEQEFEDEANDLLSSWNRTTLLEEVKLEREKLKLDKSDDYYDGEAYFKDIAADMEPIGSGQVLIKVLEPNSDGKAINGSHTIMFDRIGYLEHELKPFESSIYDGKPSKMNLAEDSVVGGLLMGLIHLREGERANIMIKSSMAFGPLGCPPLIPGDAWLFYHVKIYKVWEASELRGLLDYERDNHLQFGMDDKLKLVEDHKRLANQYLMDDQIKEALVMYKAAIKCLEEAPEGELKANQHAYKMMIVLLQNASIAMNRLGMHKSATKFAKRALFMDPNNIKAYYQLVKARISLDDYSGALSWIEKADRYFPNSKCFDNLKLQVDFQKRHERERRDSLMKRMSQGLV